MRKNETNNICYQDLTTFYLDEFSFFSLLLLVINIFIYLRSGLFVIDPATGIVTTTRNMTGYASPVNYVLNISATDSGKPAPLTAYTTLNISVQSVAQNGGVPNFTQPATDSQAFGVYEVC